MFKNKFKIAIASVALASVFTFSNIAFAGGGAPGAVGSSAKVGGTVATASIDTVAEHSKNGAAGIKISATINGVKQNVTSSGSATSDGKKGGGGTNTGGGGGSNTAPSGPSCYVWEYYGGYTNFDTVLWNRKGENLLKYGGTTDYLKVDDIYGPRPEFNGTANMTLEEKKLIEGLKVFIVKPNPKALKDFGGYPGSKSNRCGSFPGTDVGDVYITSKPVIGWSVKDKAKGYDIEKHVAQSVSNSGGMVYVDLKEVSKGKYKAQIEFGGIGKDDLGLAPYGIKEVTYVWTVRGPSKSEPLLKTDTLSNIGVSSKSLNSMSNLTYPFSAKQVGTSNGFSTSSLKTALSQSYKSANPASSLSGSYSKKASEKLFTDRTIKHLTGILAPEPNTINSLNSNGGASVFQTTQSPKKKTASGTTPLVVGGKINGAYSNVLTDEFTLPASIANKDGKVIVAVSVIINGTYRIATDFDAGSYVEFNYPLGYVSSGANKFTSSCAQLQSSFSQLANQKVDDVGALQLRADLEGSSCKQEQWREGKAVAKVTATGDGRAKLDGTASKPPAKRTVIFSYVAETKDIACTNNPTNDPNCTETIFTGKIKKVNQVDMGWKTYSITGYYWYPKHRIDMVKPNLGKKEIDFEGKPYGSENSVMYAKLNNGNTYACLGVTTTAGKSYGAFNGSISGVSNINTYKKTDRNFGKSGKSPLQIVDSGTYQYCDAIITEEKDRRIIENWGK